MLFKTYQKITTLFKQHHGYMSFSDLRDHQVTVLQLAEMEEEGSLERFARGWYWCKECGYEKPKDYQYIEIAKVNPRAVICMDSAAWLAGKGAGNHCGCHIPHRPEEDGAGKF